MNNLKVIYTDSSHIKFAEEISILIANSSHQRTSGIAQREPNYIASKMKNGNGVIAVDGDKVVGFSYIESWSHGDYIATSGLIVDPEYRRRGIAEQIKEKTFHLARERYPKSKIFSLTTSLAVMKLNTRLGYEPVTLSELTHDEEFWQGCEGCLNYDILKRNNNKICLCYGMLYTPSKTNKSLSWLTPYMMASKNLIKKLFKLK